MRANGWPKLLRDTVGMKARTVRDMRNGYVSIPAGTLVTLERSTGWMKMNFGTERCVCCGSRAFFARVRYVDLRPEPVAAAEEIDQRLLQLADDGCPHA